jgi:predicted nucleic acid-binding protein
VSLYAESSAILGWLLGEPEGAAVRRALSAAPAVVSSDLTLIECERTLIRASVNGQLTEVDAGERSATLARATAHWVHLRMTPELLERVRRPFPVEPIRSFDAIHLASALAARAVFPDLRLLTLDERIRENGRRLGFKVVP